MNPMDYVTRYVRVIEVVMIIAALIAVAEMWHHHNVAQQKLGYDKAVAEYTEKDNVNLKQALSDTAIYKQLYEEAKHHETERDNVNRAAADTAAAAAAGLQHTLETISGGVRSDTLDTLRQTTATLATVLNECRSRYQELGQKADGHVNDVQTLTEAWPQQPKEKQK